jgi:Second Messenger Oligonucleotide or Dinucleotide Synthetase domain/Adenylyl/Guanylyl and SMODS C-terminal sensor domain
VKLHDYFAGLLADTVNLDETRLAQLDTRVGNIVAAVKADTVLKDLYVDHIPQGSWPHKTIICPLPNREFDADFLLRLTPVDEWEPQDYLKQTRAAFKRSFAYKDKVRKKNRCVRIGYVNDCHVDVVPYLVLPDGRQVIVDYRENDYEDTNPAGFTAWMREKDGLANGHLRRTIRLVKYLRDYKQTFSAPSVILTTLLGGRVQSWDADRLYPDFPTAFVELLTDLDAWLSLYSSMPLLEDPSCPGTFFNHRWTEERYVNFAKWIKYYAAKAKAALEEQDKDTSIALWREIFGDAFDKSTAPQAAAEVASLTAGAVVSKAAVRAARAPGEEFIEERGYALRPTYTARIDATVREINGFRPGTPLRRLRRVGKRMKVNFTLLTDCPEPFDLFWKVRNTGPEAGRVTGGYRGQLLADDGSRTRKETTQYRGGHYVEAYVVKNGVVVATDHHDVDIE